MERSIDVAGIGIFNGMSPAVHPGGLGRILSQIRFGSTLNIAASLANPMRPTHGVRGVYADGMLGPVGDVMMEIGYEHAMVVHGYDDRREAGMDELSVLGASVVSELHADGRRDSYTVEPEDWVRRAVAQRDRAARRPALRGRALHPGARRPRLTRPAATPPASTPPPSSTWPGQAADLGDGLAQAREAVASGAALAKLEEWVAACSPAAASTSARPARPASRRCVRRPASRRDRSRRGVRRLGAAAICRRPRRRLTPPPPRL